MRRTYVRELTGVLVLAGFLLAVTTACRSTETMGTQVDDSWITTKVKSQLAAAPEVSSFDISVTTQEGVVTLTGRVKTMDAKREAVKLARHTRGVKEVVDQIMVGSIVPNEQP